MKTNIEITEDNIVNEKDKEDDIDQDEEDEYEDYSISTDEFR